MLVISPPVFSNSIPKSLAPRRLGEIVVMLKFGVVYEELNRVYINKTMLAHRKKEANPTHHGEQYLYGNVSAV